MEMGGEMEGMEGRGWSRFGSARRIRGRMGRISGISSRAPRFLGNF